MKELTPMMQQYFSIKKDYEDCILLYRLGDFYEMFFEDAKIASEELGLTLTGRDCGLEKKAPMCGVPFHSVNNYIGKLIKNGYKIAICEQIEDPKNTKKIVKRDVVRVITSGTVIDENLLETNKNNYILCIYENKTGFGIAMADITTGEFLTTNFFLNEYNKVVDEIAKFNPAEIIINKDFKEKEILENVFNIKANIFYSWTFEYINSYKKLCDHFEVLSLNGFGINDNELCIGASGALLEYLYITQKNAPKHIFSIKKYESDKFMVLDISSRRNLELCQTIKDNKRKGSLLSILDKTKTAMGARLLRKWIEQPLLECKEINLRLDAIEEYKKDIIFMEDIRDYLSKIKDIERIISKLSYKTINARDMNILKSSIKILPEIKNILSNLKSPLNKEVYENLDCLEDIYNLINNSIKENDVPTSIKEGNIIKNNYNKTIDTYREAKNKGDIWIENLLENERKITGIKNLKIKYNKVLGYYIEVTNSYKNIVPEYYIRKQTLSNAERYITKELKTIEETILNAEDKLASLEYEIFENIRDEISNSIERINIVASNISIIDVLQSLAKVAQENKYVKPVVNNEGIIDIKDGRHPVVEIYNKEPFITNDTFLNKTDNIVAIITGPNMVGKSTYMRQTALIVLMAQIGSFVPAKKASIGVVDRIFTRVGASDDLATGKSTFMLEMVEVANILNNATRNSLLILDEVGRGTATYDGLSIANAILEYIADKNKIGAKTLFSTHYYELTYIEGLVEGVVNYCIKAEEIDGNIVFLRKVEKGKTDKSYGVHVASLAGIPNSVICRANELLEIFSCNEFINNLKRNEKEETEPIYFGNRKNKLLGKNSKYNDIITELIKMNIEKLTPKDAIETLYRFKKYIND